jgi:DNA-binding transcriptional regulator YiaG
MNPTPTQLKTARSNAGLSQKQAAELCHVTLAGYQHWEYGKRKMSPATWELFKIKTESKSRTKML